MKPTFSSPRPADATTLSSGVSAMREAHDTAAVDAAQPEAACRFQALLAKRQGATTAPTTATATPSADVDHDAARADADARDTRLRASEHAEGRNDSTGPPPTDPPRASGDAASDRLPWPDAFRGDGDATGTTTAADAVEVDESDAGPENTVNDGDTPQNATAAREAAPDKRSWGIGPTLPGAPALGPRASFALGNGSSKSLAAFDGTSRRPARSRGTIGVTATNAHRLHDPSNAAEDLAASRAETLGHLVTQLLARYASTDHPALANDAGAHIDGLPGDLNAPISIRVDHVFPETLLTLTISEPSISLRFQSRSAESRALLSDQRNALASRVTSRTGRATHIDIVA